MRISEYQRMGVDIATLPIWKLRAIDIQTVEEEKEVARLLAEKSKDKMPETKVFIDDIKARMDKEIIGRTMNEEKEKQYQSEIDARIANAKAKANEAQQAVEAKVFCQYCSAKGPIKHMADCTKPK